MTLIAAGAYPSIISDEANIVIEGIVIISDSRISTKFGEYKDIGQKIFQFQDTSLICCCGNVEFYEEVVKSIRFTLESKKQRFYTLKSLIEYIEEVIKFKRNFLMKKYGTEIIGQFLVASVNDDNKPELYGFNYEFDNNYDSIKLFVEESLELIGENPSYQDRLKVQIKKEIQRVLDSDSDNGCELNSIPIHFKRAYETYLTNNRSSKVGGVAQMYIVKPYPEGVLFISYADLNIDDEDNVNVTSVTYDIQDKKWVKLSNERIELERTYENASLNFRNNIWVDVS